MTQQNSDTNEKMLVQQFIQFVLVQAQNILFVLGKIPTPDGAVMPPNLSAAKMLIDQLEMIRHKTEGNLNSHETKILNEALENVNMAFVEVSGGTPASMMPSRTPQYDLPEMEEEEADETELSQETQARPSQLEEEKPQVSEENKKKYYKSYG
jgi:hypothetical protein